MSREVLVKAPPPWPPNVPGRQNYIEEAMVAFWVVQNRLVMNVHEQQVGQDEATDHLHHLDVRVAEMENLLEPILLERRGYKAKMMAAFALVILLLLAIIKLMIQ